MDSLTQAILGASIGQVVGYRRLGAKALVFGAIGGVLPDLDILAMLGGDAFSDWKYHRHITHSLWFGPIFGALAGWWLWQREGSHTGRLRSWMAVMILSLLTHPLLDVCTIYGTQLLAPFSDQRFAIPAVSIVDPFYTFALLAGMVPLLFPSTRVFAAPAAFIALGVTSLYLVYGFALNKKAESWARDQLAAESPSPLPRLDVFTTTFQPFLRRVVVTEDDRVRVGFVSTFAPGPIVWICQTQVSPSLREAILQTEEGRLLYWFSGGLLSFSEEPGGNGILVTDARYGIPGESAFGWWGLRFRVEGSRPNGTPRPIYVSRFQKDVQADWPAIKNLFRAAYGLPNTFMPEKEENCTAPGTPRRR